MSRRLPALAALATLALVQGTMGPAGPALAQVQARLPDEGPEQYPAGAHRDETFYFCVACHSFRVVSRQAMSRERWDETLHWMSDKHAMPKLEGRDREEILVYLATAFPQAAGGQAAGGFQNPFASGGGAAPAGGGFKNPFAP